MMNGACGKELCCIDGLRMMQELACNYFFSGKAPDFLAQGKQG